MSEGPAEIEILVLVGSLRKASLNRQMAHVAMGSAPDHVRMELFDALGELPWYNEDIDNAELGGSVRTLRNLATRADAFLTVTPEYNGSIPGALKNAIDWLSRPYGRSPLQGKPVAVIGASLGQYGGVWAHDETRRSFGIAGCRVAEGITLSWPTKGLEGKSPADHDELAAKLHAAVRDLAEVVRH